MAQSYARDCKSAVIPSRRYRDCLKAIDWLVEVFGFEKQVVYEGPNGTVGHAQLTFGNGMIMLGSESNGGAWRQLSAQPDEIGGRSTSIISLIVTDAAILYERAKAAGAEMVQELAEMPYGGKAFGCRDLEGHLWRLGNMIPGLSSRPA